MKQRKHKKRRNEVAKDLRTPKYRQRVEKPAKGKGSFKREKKILVDS